MLLLDIIFLYAVTESNLNRSLLQGLHIWVAEGRCVTVEQHSRATGGAAAWQDLQLGAVKPVPILRINSLKTHELY